MSEPRHLKLSVDARGVATLQIANGTSLNILDSDTITEMTAMLHRFADRQGETGCRWTGRHWLATRPCRSQ